MNISISVVLFFLILIIALIFLRRNIWHNVTILKPVTNYYSEVDRRNRIKSFFQKINKPHFDLQKMIFKEGIFLIIVLFIMYAIVFKLIFFTAVVSGSMVPTFERGDLLLMQNFDRSYRVGDIVMFNDYETNRPYTHRIQSITKEGIRTKGDAFSEMDYWFLTKEKILGKAIIINGKPIVLKGYGNYFIIESKDQDLGPFGSNYRNYILFFSVIKTYGYVIAGLSLLIYIFLTSKEKS